MKIIEINMKILEINANHKISNANDENLENSRNPLQNYENHENIKNQLEKFENHVNFIIPFENNKKSWKYWKSILEI